MSDTARSARLMREYIDASPELTDEEKTVAARIATALFPSLSSVAAKQEELYPGTITGRPTLGAALAAVVVAYQKLGE